MDINRRWLEHKAALRKGKHSNRHLQYSWDKYGEGQFEFFVIEIVESEDFLLDREQNWIDSSGAYTHGLNLSDLAGAGGSDRLAKNYIVTFPDGKEEQIRNLAKFCRANNLNIGAMVAVSKGKVNQHKGYKVRSPSQSTEQWQDTVTRSTKVGHGWKGKYQIVTPDGETLVITSLTSFCVQRGLSQGNMTEVASGRRKQHKGYRCSYLPLGENSTK